MWLLLIMRVWTYLRRTDQTGSRQYFRPLAGRGTSRYVYRIMAIKQIFENPYKYCFVLRAEDLYKPVACEDVAVSSDIPDLSAFAQKYDITYADLKRC